MAQSQTSLSSALMFAMLFSRSVDALPDAQGAAQHALVIVVFSLLFAAAAVAFKGHIFPISQAGIEICAQQL